MPDSSFGPGLSAMAAAAQMAIDYRREIAAAQRTPVASYADMLIAFDGDLPVDGGDAEEIIRDLARRATPGIRAMTGPRFYGWVIGSSHPTGVAADWLTAAWGQNAGNLVAAPAASAVETVAAGWLLDLLGLPTQSSVGFVTGATVANFVCLAAARSEVLRRVGWDVEADGLFGAPPVQVLIGTDAHATVYSALKYLGFGAARAHIVDTDELGRIRPEAFERLLASVEGPVIAIAQAGQINTGACDPFEKIAPLAKAAGAWLHVDGAFGLWAQASPNLASLSRGVELADSWATDGHKWLQTPYDCGYAIVRDADAHRRAMAISASYLPPAANAEREPSAYVPELSRRARGFATWAMMRQLGRRGIADMIEHCHHIARTIAEGAAATEGVTLVCPVTLNQFMLRFGDSGHRSNGRGHGTGDDRNGGHNEIECAEADRLTLATVRQVQDEAIAFIGAASWRGQWVMRVSVSSIATTMDDARLTVEAIVSAWHAVRTAKNKETQ